MHSLTLRYDGYFKDNKFSGFGTYRWSDGRVYEGDWDDNQMHGYGEYKWPDGKLYKGEVSPLARYPSIVQER